MPEVNDRFIRIPVVADLEIETFSAGVINSAGSYIQNGVIMKYPAGDFYVTQRPSFEKFNTTAAPDARGRGIYYWENASQLYIVNNDTAYYNDYNNTMTLATNASHSTASADADGFTAGNQKVYTAELNGQLFFIDPVNNEGKYIIDATTNKNILYDMDNGSGEHSTDDFSNFPPNNSKTLAHGVAVLDGTLYVLTTDAQVWGSDLNDGGSWSSALNFITAEKEEDSGVYIDKHHDNIVVFGRRTIEFFYDAANPTGSPLSSRDDISYNIGCADPMSVWRNGDDIYFLGIDTSGQIAPYVLSNFQLHLIGNSSVSSFLTTSKSVSNISTVGSGLSSGQTTYYVITTYHEVGSNIIPDQSIVYNSSTKTWTIWVYGDSTVSQFPLVQWTITDDSRIGEGIFASGELISIKDNYNPADSEDGFSYITSGYIGDGYYTSSSGTASALTMVIRLNHWDGKNRNWKRHYQLRYVGDATVSSENLLVRWADDKHYNYNSGRNINISDPKNKLTRIGRFKSRSFQLEYSGDEQIRIEAIELEASPSEH